MGLYGDERISVSFHNLKCGVEIHGQYILNVCDTNVCDFFLQSNFPIYKNAF